MPLIVFHGDRDNIVAPINADRLIASRIGGLRRRRAACGRRPRPTTETNPAVAIAARSTGTWTAGSSPSNGPFTAVHTPGSAAVQVGSYTDAQGPDASAEMLRFFLEHTPPVTAR